MTSDELRWAHMTPAELARELTIRTDLTQLESILLARLEEVLDELEISNEELDRLKPEELA